MHSAFSQAPGENRKIRNVAWYIPSKADQINGWAIGWLMLGAFEKDSVTINGFYTNISPLPALIIGFGLPYIIAAPFMKRKSEYWTELDSNIYGSHINGIAISFIMEEADTYIVNGLQISGISHGMYKLNGLSLTLGLSDYASFKGVMISGLNNNATHGKGLQIGLINRAKNLTGIQIGLWNRIGKRGLPFINMSFKKKDN